MRYLAVIFIWVAVCVINLATLRYVENDTALIIICIAALFFGALSTAHMNGRELDEEGDGGPTNVQ